VLVASVLSELTDAVTSAIGDYGLYAVFVLMLVDAVFPAASEVVMVYAGAVASLPSSASRYENRSRPAALCSLTS